MDGRDFAGRRVLVTGAGKGIGRATAVLLHRRGAEVIAATRSPEDLASLAQETGCRTIAVDLGDAEATRRAATEALPVDALVNCAGTTTLEILPRHLGRELRPDHGGERPGADDRGPGGGARPDPPRRRRAPSSTCRACRP